MKSILCVTLAAAVLSGSAMVSAGGDQGRGRKAGKQQGARVVVQNEPRVVVNYFAPRDVTIIREYYRPYYQPLPPGLAKKYYRTGTLPPGWQKKIRPLPGYIERDLYVLPAGYYRGVIDGRAVVYNSRGVIIDIAVLF